MIRINRQAWDAAAARTGAPCTDCAAMLLALAGHDVQLADDLPATVVFRASGMLAIRDAEDVFATHGPCACAI